MADERKECCKKEENLKISPSNKPELFIRKCVVCGCRHFELSLELGVIGITGKD